MIELRWLVRPSGVETWGIGADGKLDKHMSIPETVLQYRDASDWKNDWADVPVVEDEG